MSILRATRFLTRRSSSFILGELKNGEIVEAKLPNVPHLSLNFPVELEGEGEAWLLGKTFPILAEDVMGTIIETPTQGPGLIKVENDEHDDTVFFMQDVPLYLRPEEVESLAGAKVKFDLVKTRKSTKAFITDIVLP
ncbi:Oidioi.mRNA.OKI2018_I69.chr1.g648.t1.cds [Oikopleura dioica]|uniref:Oidioi.mRNA.OKI2018_I69.chr1.g648.t1.cds n=1 Tax=Oikopleura dioica TaxID=34765 RepID=A0ABN7SPC1_OIKDI|nr:Oidioi.mRNA.OKI2018_I69.chr1.g648.t1.cds [Oikopleura dioica]